MKGIILAGGLATRLYPCTYAVNKHLLPIYDKPMIFYPIESLVKAGCTDILIISGDALTDIAKTINNSSHLGIHSLLLAYQPKPSGIADALRLAKTFVGHDKFCMILGDNLIFDDLTPFVNQFEQSPENTCQLFIKHIDNPTAFGVAEITDGKITNIIEKPENPPTNYAVIGVYMYDYHVFDIIEHLKPSARGEYEITDVNMDYIKRGKANHVILNDLWLDTGTFSSLFEASQLIAKRYQ